MSNTNEDQERADRIRGYKEEAMKGPFIRQKYICVHPAVDKFWITGSLRQNPKDAEAILNAHFILHNGERKDLLDYAEEHDSFNKLLQDAEAYCQSLSKE